MTSSDGDDGPPDAARGSGHSEQVTVDAVKSAILDRLLADLGAGWHRRRAGGHRWWRP